MGRNPLLLWLSLPTSILTLSYFLGGCTGLPWWLRWERICLQCRRPGFNPWFRKIPWRREWLPTPVFLPGEFHEQRSLVGCSPWGFSSQEYWTGFAMPFSRGSSQSRDWTQVSRIAGGFFPIWATREALWNFSYLSFSIFFLGQFNWRFSVSLIFQRTNFWFHWFLSF